jgi:glutathionyl-hydroquinone reductase
MQNSKEVYEANLVKLDAKLDVYDKILSQQKYLAGEVSISVAYSTRFPEY